MILFEKDWQYYPTALPDFDTGNKSAVRTAALLKKLGFRNWRFPLALIDQGLKGLDPWDTNLTQEIQERMMAESKRNPFYFFREVFRAPKRAGAKVGGYFQFNRANVSTIWLFYNHCTNYLIQPRQTGKSFVADGIDTHLLFVGTTDTEIHLITKDNGLRVKNLASIKKARDESIPAWMNMCNRSDVANQTTLSVKALGNSIQAHVGQPNEFDADKVGRGFSTPVVMVDEGPYINNIKVILEAAMPAMSAAIEIARENNAPYGILFTTTAGHLGNPNGAYMYDRIMKAAFWTEAFYDCKDLEDLEAVIRRNGIGGENGIGPYAVHSTWSYAQLGKDKKWALEVIERGGLSKEKADRELYNIWITSSSDSPFTPEQAELISSAKRDVLHQKMYDGGYVIRWYIPEYEIHTRMNSGNIIIGMDTSDMVGSDDTALCIVDGKTGEVIGAGTFNDSNLTRFTNWLIEFLITFKETVLVIERKSSAVGIIDALLLALPSLGEDPFKRMFNWIVNDADSEAARYKEIARSNNRHLAERHKRLFGFATSGSGSTSRDNLYSNVMFEALRIGGANMKDSMLINQLSTLVHRNGRVDHAPGKHDDTVIAWLMCFWFITQGKNLGYYKGIDVFKLLKAVPTTKEVKPVSLEDRMLASQQERFRDEIKELTSRLENTRDESVAYYLNERLDLLEGKMIMNHEEIRTMSDMVQLAKENHQRLRSSDSEYNASSHFKNKPMGLQSGWNRLLR